MPDRRDDIVAAAKELATEHGLRAVSVRAVAARAGVGASTLRHYFPTQRALFDATADATFDEQLSDLRIRDRRVSPARRLVECLRQFVPEGAQLEQWALSVSAVAAVDADPERRRLWTQLTRRAHERVEAWLAVLAEEGALRDGDPARQTRLLLLGVDGMALRLLTAEDRADTDVDELLHDLVAVVLR
ncbi:hypothetical protein BJF85_02330 [Saccharomonospora sp. CUA-673]|uniref:TetR/AcrR family transcriptional regulator n=1 Tax=Saccharomonospora sp. CUA-673 TaxID=1904969 RepID=UPI00095B5408|nr:TetR/AcrR family transcriptional regulator [Saccharomonospora sp. CUA-673]OLT45236.1 hypothetical protein BJF85_02330 [Saccharomonospora sp. CUA-673]